MNSRKNLLCGFLSRVDIWAKASKPVKRMSATARSDKYVIPLALLVLGFMINSWRLLIVTLLNFLTAVRSNSQAKAVSEANTW